MPRADNRYSQFVMAAKIILPLLALGLLSSLFLLSGAPDGEQTIPFSEMELEEIVEGQRILRPRYQTVLDSGATARFTAESARPDLRNPDRFMASEITGQIVQPDGIQIDFRGAEGVMDNASRTLRIDGGLRLSRTDGFTLSARGAEVALDGQWAETTSDVIVLGPGLTLSAGRAVMRPDADSGAREVVFTDGVKLVYTRQ
jgi:lipopolysaccharide export system protein LptC